MYHLLSKFLGERKGGYFVEVGAYDGRFASNTWGLAEQDWNGLLIEPIPDLAEACRKNYAHRERIRVIQVAIGGSNRDVTLHLAGTLTTANTEAYEEYSHIEWAKSSLTPETLTVRSRTLDEVLVEQNVPQGFDLLVVDVEGFECEVFSGFRLEKWAPRMVIVELADTHPDLTVTRGEDALLGYRLSSAGYIITYKDAINTVFVRDDVWKLAFGIP